MGGGAGSSRRSAPGCWCPEFALLFPYLFFVPMPGSPHVLCRDLGSPLAPQPCTGALQPQGVDEIHPCTWAGDASRSPGNQGLVWMHEFGPNEAPRGAAVGTQCFGTRRLLSSIPLRRIISCFASTKLRGAPCGIPAGSKQPCPVLGWDPSLAGVIVNDAWGAAELLRVRKNKLNGGKQQQHPAGWFRSRPELGWLDAFQPVHTMERTRLSPPAESRGTGEQWRGRGFFGVQGSEVGNWE